jgi:ligand-binding SRPBCC domain-containing protein
LKEYLTSPAVSACIEYQLLTRARKAIAGITNGLINEGETVTWQAKHLFKLRSFTSKITTMRRPDFFVDEMIQGDFKSFKHEHHFKSVENGTIMIDKVEFESPYAVAGKLFNKFFLHKLYEGIAGQKK